MTATQTLGVQINLPVVGRVENRASSLESEVLIIDDRRHFSTAVIMVGHRTLRKDYYFGLPQFPNINGDFKGSQIIPEGERMFFAFVLGRINDQGTQRLAYARSGTPPTQYEPKFPADTSYPIVGFPVIHTINLDDIMAFREIESREDIGKEFALNRVT